MVSRHWYLSLALAGGLAVVLAGCDRESADGSQPREEGSVPAKNELIGELQRDFAGDAMPEMTFKDAEGNELALASLKGKPVLVNLWATWCVPCVLEMPMLDELAEDYGDRLKVVTVSEDTNGEELVPKFFADKNYRHLEPWLDHKSDMIFALGGAGAMPTTVLYDSDGKEIWRVLGGYDWSSEEARAQIEEAFGG